MNTKKILMWGSSTSMLIFLVSFYLFSARWCYEGSVCNNVEYILSKSGIYELVFYLTVILFTLSLITYRLKDDVFRAWWNFARWWVPIIIVATLFLENAGGGGIGIESVIQGDFVFVVLLLLYYILIAISLARIIHVYLQLRWKEDTFKEKREYLNKVFKWIYGILSLPLVLFIVGIIINLSVNNS